MIASQVTGVDLLGCVQYAEPLSAPYSPPRIATQRPRHTSWRLAAEPRVAHQREESAEVSPAPELLVAAELR